MYCVHRCTHELRCDGGRCVGRRRVLRCGSVTHEPIECLMSMRGLGEKTLQMLFRGRRCARAEHHWLVPVPAPAPVLARTSGPRYRQIDKSLLLPESPPLLGKARCPNEASTQEASGPPHDDGVGRHHRLRHERMGQACGGAPRPDTSARSRAGGGRIGV